MRTLLVIFLFLCVVMIVPGEETRDMDWYITEAQEAVEGERYEYAVSVLMEAGSRFPDAAVFPQMLGDLYYEKELYSLALKEYTTAEEREPENFTILYSIATTEGMLNRDFESTATLEKIIELYPDSPEVIIDLGWMYFKTFQLKKGEKILVEALETYGVVPGISMTLGTVYSGMYEYEKSKKHYLESIDAALEAGRMYFTSVAYYNLSLLEQNFYKFNDALEATRSSLQAADRASGHIALGELYQLQADYDRARAEYERAFSIDTTPLAMMNLADLHSESGNPERALTYLKEVMNTEDTSWMFYFGTDIKRHQLELHRIYSDVYAAMARGALKTPGRWIEGFLKPVRFLAYRALSWYHGRRHKALCLDVGRSYLEDGNTLDANWFFYQGNADYRDIALKYLARAEEFETSIAPEAVPYYLLEYGKVRSDIGILSEAAAGLSSEWDRSGRVEALAHMAPLLYRKKPGEAADRFRELYRINRGAFIRYGLSLPVYPVGDMPGSLRRCLNRSYFRLVGTPEHAAFILSLRDSGEGAIEVDLLDPVSEKAVFTMTSHFLPDKYPLRVSLASEIVAKVFDID